MPEQLQRRAQIHAALAEPIRLGIVDELALSDRSPAELAEHLAIRSNLLAHHIDVLENAGLVERSASQGDRRRRYVRLRRAVLVEVVHPPLLQAAGVLFVCTRNSARSQLAAALWNEHSPLPATSAGTEPADRVHPGAVRAARRRSIDLTGAEPRALAVADADGRLVVTVCDLAHEEMAGWAEVAARSGLPALHWSVPDPARSGRAADFDAAADELARRINALAPLVVSP